MKLSGTPASNSAFMVTIRVIRTETYLTIVFYAAKNRYVPATIGNDPKIVQLISGVKQKFVLNGCIVTFNWHLGLFSLITVASITPRIVSSICLCVGPALVPESIKIKGSPEENPINF